MGDVGAHDPRAAERCDPVNQPELWILSLQAFTAVVVVLGSLAIVVVLLGMVAPARVARESTSRLSHDVHAAKVVPGEGEASVDPFVHAAALAAVRATTAGVAPGAEVRVVREITSHSTGPATPGDPR